VSSERLLCILYFLINIQRRTGIIYNVTPSAVGVIVYKVVGNRYIEKRVNLRVEHVRHSKCRQEFLDRVKRIHDAHAAAKAKGGECVACSLYLLSFLTLLSQNVSTSSAFLSSLEEHTPSLRRRTLPRRWSLFLTRQQFRGIVGDTNILSVFRWLYVRLLLSCPMLAKHENISYDIEMSEV